jgi:hypothetical protein
VITLANGPVFWIGLLAGLGGLYVLPTVIAVFRRVENIGVVVLSQLGHGPCCSTKRKAVEYLAAGQCPIRCR